jgi:hypothetical protein
MGDATGHLGASFNSVYSRLAHGINARWASLKDRIAGFRLLPLRILMQANSIPVELLNLAIDALHLRRVRRRMQQLPLLLNFGCRCLRTTGIRYRPFPSESRRRRFVPNVVTRTKAALTNCACGRTLLALVGRLASHRERGSIFGPVRYCM